MVTVCAVNVIGYVRVSADDQAESGAELLAQPSRRSADAAVGALWRSTRAPRQRELSSPDLGSQRALQDVERGAGEALVVAKLDRLSRSLLDFSALMEKSRKRGWALVALDLGVDTTTPAGEMMAPVLATFAQYERRLIGLRTKEALAIKRSQGVRLGRRSTLAPSTRRRIVALRARGTSYARIAERLNGDGVGTGQGGRRWYSSSVQAVLRSARAEAPVGNNSPRDREAKLRTART